MTDYPRLTEMGIMHPDQIDRFMVNSISNYDALRIIYVRRKGSLLPESRTYKFPRVQKYLIEENGKRRTTVMEMNPDLSSAVSELEDLLKVKEQKQDLSEAILEQLELLEEDIAMRSECIKKMISQV
jgi:hypothetical protein